jgi:hypothetical protein
MRPWFHDTFRTTMSVTASQDVSGRRVRCHWLLGEAIREGCNAYIALTCPDATCMVAGIRRVGTFAHTASNNRSCVHSACLQLWHTALWHHHADDIDAIWRQDLCSPCSPGVCAFLRLCSTPFWRWGRDFWLSPSAASSCTKAGPPFSASCQGLIGHFNAAAIRGGGFPGGQCNHAGSVGICRLFPGEADGKHTCHHSLCFRWGSLGLQPRDGGDTTEAVPFRARAGSPSRNILLAPAPSW